MARNRALNHVREVHWPPVLIEEELALHWLFTHPAGVMATCKDMHIRTATIDDLLAMNDIYNHYVLHSTSTYQTEPETLDARRAWFSEHDEKHPVIVASDVAGAVLGWGSLSRFHARAAYARTVENSIYVHHHHQRRGIGRALLTELISRACALDHHTIIAGIDADQPASLALHAAGGFTQVARLDEVGHKFGRWLHVIYMQKML